jgi:hypothetical protein
MSFDFNRMLQREINVGKKDQQLRLGAGVGLLVVAWMINTPLLMLLAIILIATAVMRWCPAYSGMGKSTVEPGDTAP